MKWLRYWWSRFWEWKVPRLDDPELLTRLWALQKRAEAYTPTSMPSLREWK